MARAPNKLSFDCIESAAKKIYFEIRGMLQKLVDLQKIKGVGLLQDKSCLTSCVQDSEDSRSRRPAGCRRKGRSRREGCGRLFFILLKMIFHYHGRSYFIWLLSLYVVDF